jgi:hypothetical protein
MLRVVLTCGMNPLGPGVITGPNVNAPVELLMENVAMPPTNSPSSPHTPMTNLPEKSTAATGASKPWFSKGAKKGEPGIGAWY